MTRNIMKGKLVIIIFSLFVFVLLGQEKGNTYKYGQVGLKDVFVTDETEIRVGEWIEFVLYKNIQNFPSSYSFNKVSKWPAIEINHLINDSIDKNLLPNEEFMNTYKESYIFHKPKRYSFFHTSGGIWSTTILIDEDSMQNKTSLEKIKYFLDLPISGITYEQALAYCAWRTMVDSLQAIYFKANGIISPIETYIYKLPSIEQHNRINFSLDSIPLNSKYLSNFNYKNAHYSKNEKDVKPNLYCGNSSINTYSYKHRPKTFYDYWVKNTQGNVAEMTDVKGIAKGGSYYHPAKESYPDKEIKYDSSTLWLGFRCIGIKRTDSSALHNSAIHSQSDTIIHASRQFLTFYGIQGPDLSGLNNVFSPYNYPKFKQNIFSSCVAFLKYKDNLLLQTNLFYYSTFQRKDMVTSFIGSYGAGGSFGYGYLLRDNFQMYSLIGLNYWFTTVKVSSNLPSFTSFNNYSSLIGNQIEMITNTFTTNLETHINYITNPAKDPTEKRRFVLGISGGYHIPLNKSKWRTNNEKLDNGPNINPGGYYVMFMLGFKYR